MNRQSHDPIDVSNQIRALSQEVRGGFQEMRKRFDRIERQLTDVIDITNRVYDEHGRRLADIEARLPNPAGAE